jgi:hypothetical protein
MTLLEAMADRHLFAPWFRDPATWAAWRAFIAALFALPMTAEQQLTFEVLRTGKRHQKSPRLKLGSFAAAAPARASSWR